MRTLRFLTLVLVLGVATGCPDDDDDSSTVDDDDATADDDDATADDDDATADDDDATADDDDATADDDDATADDDDATADDDDATGDDDDATVSPPTSCAGIGTSTLTGACIWFADSGDSWTVTEAAAGISIPYVVIVEADIPEVVPMAQDAGGCDTPGASGLTLFEDLAGGAEHYCICDQGLCGSPPLVPVILPAGQTPGAFAWTGVNWTGPSDTGNPYGAPFPAGAYTLEVSTIGRVDGVNFSVSNTFAVTLTP